MHASISSVRPSTLLFRSGGAVACMLTLAAGLSLSSAPAYADAAACKALQDAMIANTKTPYHSFATIHFDYSATVSEARRKMKLPREQSSETIFTGKSVYVRLLPGKWQPLPTTLAKFQANVRASVEGMTDCKKLADNKIDGTPVSIYVGRTKQNNRPVVTEVWVSEKGVPLKSMTAIDLGGPVGVETLRETVSTRYKYGNIQAPSMD